MVTSRWEALLNTGSNEFQVAFRIVAAGHQVIPLGREFSLLFTSCLNDADRVQLAISAFWAWKRKEVRGYARNHDLQSYNIGAFRAHEYTYPTQVGSQNIRASLTGPRGYKDNFGNMIDFMKKVFSGKAAATGEHTRKKQNQVAVKRAACFPNLD